MTSVLGLDIGGSTTRGQLVVDGATVARASGPSASLTAAGEALAQRHLSAVVGELRAHRPEAIDAVCVGAAGSGTGPARQWLTRTVSELTGTQRVSVVSDGELVLAAAGLSEGIAIVCGTGSIVHGLGPEGAGRAGGWGWLLGDEGGGYALVRDALRTALARRDAARPGGPLQDALLDAAGVETLDGLLGAFYGEPRPERWAALAPAVLACADPDVAELVAGGARTVARRAAPLARRVGLSEATIVLAGGLVSQPAVHAALQSALHAELPGWPVVALDAEPVSGAVALALAAVDPGR